MTSAFLHQKNVLLARHQHAFIEIDAALLKLRIRSGLETYVIIQTGLVTKTKWLLDFQVM